MSIKSQGISHASWEFSLIEIGIGIALGIDNKYAPDPGTDNDPEAMI